MIMGYPLEWVRRNTASDRQKPKHRTDEWLTLTHQA